MDGFIAKTVLKKVDIVVALVAVTVLVVRAVSGGYIFTPIPFSDEVYYITSANYLLHLAGIIRNFTPPPTPFSNVSISIESTGETPRVYISVNLSEPAGWIMIFPNNQNIDWLGAGHPMLAKLVYGVLANTVGIVAGRFVLLAVSAATLFLFLREIVRRYRLYSVPAIAVFVAFANVYPHLMYLYFLDTLMLVFLLLSAWSIMRGRHAAAAAFMALAAASKEAATIYLLPAIGLEMLRGNRKATALFIAGLVAGLIAAYAPYILFAAPDVLVREVTTMATVKDPYACRALCLLDGFTVRWGIFKLYVVFLWIWFAAPILVRQAERELQSLYFSGIGSILMFALLGFSRSIYVFYYAFLEPLSVIPLSSTAKILHLRIASKKQRMNRI